MAVKFALDSRMKLLVSTMQSGFDTNEEADDDESDVEFVFLVNNH